jgi:hypothetical protein
MQFDEMIPLYISGCLNDYDMVRFIRHIASCKTCRDEFLSLKHAVNNFNESMSTMPDNMAKEIYASLIKKLSEGSEPYEQLYDNFSLDPFEYMNRILSTIIHQIRSSFSIMKLL